MGLAQRKDKQRIGYDPRNLTWSEDKDRFSFKHMTALGWKENAGIGKDLTGNARHIAVARKADNGGIGMGRIMKEGQELSAGAGQAGAGLEDVLKRLAAKASASPRTSAAPSPSASPAPESSASATPTAIRNKMASRQKHLTAKRMASQSPAALAEILGVPVSSITGSPADSAPTSGASTPAEVESSPEPPSDPEGRNALETISTSTMSVSDYFRQKLREKMLARQAASGSSTPVPTLAEGSLAALKEETKVSAPGAEWEGTKMHFEEETTATTIVSLGGDEPPIPVAKEKKSKKEKKDKAASDDEEKAAKKARKEAKRAAKAAASSSTDSPASGLSEKEEKRRRKEEKKARKAEEGEKKEKKKEKKRKRDDEEDGEGKKRKSK